MGNACLEEEFKTFFGDYLRHLFTNYDELGLSKAALRTLIWHSQRHFMLSTQEGRTVNAVVTPRKHMLEGVYNKESGKRVCGPVGMGLRAIQKANAELIEAGYLSYTETKDDTRVYTVNIGDIVDKTYEGDLTATKSLPVNKKTMHYSTFLITLCSNLDLFKKSEELFCLVWIAQRTFGYGKKMEKMFMNHLVKGVYTGQSKEKRWQCSVGYSLNTIVKALNVLVDRKYITKSYTLGKSGHHELHIELKVEKIMRGLSKLKTPKKGETVQKMNKLHQNRAKSNKVSGCTISHQEGARLGRLNTQVKEYSSKDVISKDITSNSGIEDKNTKTQSNDEFPLTEESPSTFTPPEALASSIEQPVPTIPLTENLGAAHAAQEDSIASLTESVDTALAAVENRNQLALKKSALSIHNKISKTNLLAFWKLSLPEFGYKPRSEKIDTPSWGSIRNSDKSRRENEELGTVADIMLWAIQNWVAIVYPMLNWTTTAKYKTVPVTKQPSLVVFCRHYKHIANMFCESHSNVLSFINKSHAEDVGKSNMQEARSNAELRAEVVSLTATLEEMEDTTIQTIRRELHKHTTETDKIRREEAKRREKENPLTDERMQELYDWEPKEWGDVSPEAAKANYNRNKKRIVDTKRIEKLRVRS